MSPDGRRVLASTWAIGRYIPADREHGLFDAAIEGGCVMRQSANSGDDPDWVRLVRYVDPLDGGTRYLVETQQPDGLEWVDYPAEAVAMEQYECAVRAQVAAGYLYAENDVDATQGER